jgi:hypothetical protein
MKFSQVLADNIKADIIGWQVRFNSVEAKLDVHREKWKTEIQSWSGMSGKSLKFEI